MSDIEYGKELQIHETNIPGLTWLDLPVNGDNRGWFQEKWQRAKMIEKGLPDFGPIQNNMSFNAKAGVTRGIHAEPWDKYVSVGTGRIFGAWVDLREGKSFGQVFTLEIDPSKAVYVPRGVGNAFQVLEDQTLYSYLVNDHWSADGDYAFLNLTDTTSAIKWPIALEDAVLSDKDRVHPELADITPIKARKILVTGANGQLGKALRLEFPDAEFVDRTTFDISDKTTWGDRNWRQYSAIINAAAYTKVDVAETPEGKIDAWKANATAVKDLALLANKNNLTLVHVSSDYVFDGTQDTHTEDESFSPLGVYGQTKAAGDIAVATVEKHYIVRTSWVIGDGNNFIKTMKSLAEKGVKPSVVNDQIGRLTFTDNIAKAIHYLIETIPDYGTYNLSNEGGVASWADVAKKVFELSGNNSDNVTGISTNAYYSNKEGVAPRPLQSTLDLSKIKATGFNPIDWQTALEQYIKVL